MTEAEWLVCNSPESMLEYLRSSKVYERKYRLFALACCRRIWPLLDGWSQNLIEILERYIVGLTDRTALAFAADLHGEVLQKEKPYTPSHIAAAIVQAARPDQGSAAWPLAWNTVSEVRRALRFYSLQLDTSIECNAQASLLREIIGNPLRPLIADPSWLTWNDAALPKLARTIYGDYCFDRLPILADALEAAGCINADILNHCRQPGEHVRGCWVIDLLLGKE